MKSMIAMVFCFGILPLAVLATSPVSVNVKFPSEQSEILYSNTEVFRFLGQTPKKAKTDEYGHVKLTFEIDRPNLLIIGTNEANCRLYLIPGETYSIEFTPSAENKRIRITGNNAEGQHLINDSPRNYTVVHLLSNGALSKRAISCKFWKKGLIHLFLHIKPY